MPFDCGDESRPPRPHQLLLPGDPDIEMVRMILEHLFDYKPTILYKIGPLDTTTGFAAELPVVPIDIDMDEKDINEKMNSAIVRLPAEHSLYIIERIE